MKLLEDLNRCRISVKGKALSCFCLPPAGTLPVPIWSLWHCSLGQKQLTAELTFRSLRMASVSGWHNLGSDESLTRDRSCYYGFQNSSLIPPFTFRSISAVETVRAGCFSCCGRQTLFLLTIEWSVLQEGTWAGRLGKGWRPRPVPFHMLV